MEPLRNWWTSTSQAVKSWTGYDGAKNITEITRGLVRHMDLSKPQHFKGRKWDYVLSMEVGEHIPAQYESIFLDNVVRPAREGVVLSWAIQIPGSGLGHVNELSNAEVIERMKIRNFSFHPTYSLTLRKRTRISWLKHTLMVFIRKN